MIDVIKQTPDIYSNESRDYQVLARLYTVLFNLSKMYMDSMNIWGNNIDSKLSQLRAKTLNFNTKHLWASSSIDAATSCFKYLTKYKGTKNAILYCINILMRVYDLAPTTMKNVVEIDENYLCTIKLPEQLGSIGVVQDLLDYVLPAGVRYRIIQFRTIDEEAYTRLESLDEIVNAELINHENMGIYYGPDATKEQTSQHEGYKVQRSVITQKDSNEIDSEVQ